MKRSSIIETKNLVGQTVSLAGWVATRRDHGKLIFIDLRDRSGLIQVVFTPGNKEVYEVAAQLRGEWVVRIEGKINARPEKMINSDIPTGKVELEPAKLEVLNESTTPPFPIDTDGYEIGEESRMQYRYIDLRRPRLVNNLTARHKIALHIRNWLSERGFLEIETPILT